MRLSSEIQIPIPTAVSEDGAPTWITPDGWEWTYDASWDGCEHAMQVFDPEEPVSPDMTFPSDEGDCKKPAEYTGVKGSIRQQLCRRHFAELLQALEHAGVR
jgi:hypothetical protein